MNFSNEPCEHEHVSATRQGQNRCYVCEDCGEELGDEPDND